MLTKFSECFETSAVPFQIAAGIFTLIFLARLVFVYRWGPWRIVLVMFGFKRIIESRKERLVGHAILSLFIAPLLLWPFVTCYPDIHVQTN